MLAPLHWHDYKKKYGKLDDFVAGHPEASSIVPLAYFLYLDVHFFWLMMYVCLL